jgi:hypothetical protein
MRVEKHVTSTDASAGKGSRPLVGDVASLRGREYCGPLASPKPNHENMKNGTDFSKPIAQE